MLARGFHNFVVLTPSVMSFESSRYSYQATKLDYLLRDSRELL
jgi:hypothetical protein